MNNKKNMTKLLASTAMGVDKADIVIKNTKLVNTNTKEIINNVDIAIKLNRICLVGDATLLIGDNTEVIDGSDGFVAPGLMDGHIHIESSMLSVSEYAKVVIPKGTTSIFHDPHEIANVLGTYGVDIMINEGKNVPLRTFVTMPSCVPAISGYEIPAKEISDIEICEYLKKDEIVGLGEMMNMLGVIYGDDSIHKELEGTLYENKIITGHFTMSDYNNSLNAYIATGINCCHESVTREEALAKLRLGMYVQMREGSAWQDVKELVPLLIESNIDTRFATIVSDDTHPNTLIEKGHMDHILRTCVKLNLDPITAIQMCTINTANCFKLSDDFGSISPGKIADIVLFDNLVDFNAKLVIIDGKIVAKNGEMIVDIAKPIFNEKELNTVKLPKIYSEEDFKINVQKENGFINTNIIEIIEVKAPNRHINVQMKIKNYEVKADVENDIIKLSCIDRHNNIDQKGLGFIKGFGIKMGAVASTIAHDTHNINVMGANDKDMAFAVNEIARIGGGIVVVENEKVIAVVELPLAGLMSNMSVEYTSNKVKSVERAFEDLGCNIKSPFMTMALLSLAVIPELRLTNKGLVDTNKYKFIELFE